MSYRHNFLVFFFFFFNSLSRSMIDSHTEIKYGNDKGAHQLHLCPKRYVVNSLNWLRLYKSCNGLHNP